jgi:hypothetical protein
MTNVFFIVFEMREFSKNIDAFHFILGHIRCIIFNRSIHHNPYDTYIHEKYEH